MNFYKHYMGDYDRKTAHLSLTEHGAYRILLDHYYSTLSPLPASTQTLCRICRATTELETESVKIVAEQFFPLNGDGRRHNSRADQELNRWKQQAEINRETGKLGGRPRIHPKTDSETELITEQKPSPEVRSQKLEVRDQKPENTKGRGETTRKKKCSLPANLENLQPSARLMEWINKREEKQWKAHLTYFVGYAKANGKQYADWDQAVMNAIRDDWAKIRSAGL